MSKFRVLDLFSGIGGFSLGLERTGGFETVAFCEIEPYPRAVLKKHWPKVPCYEDVRTLTADALARDGIAVDVICGGFPCQDISFAGKGAGLAGERSGLWREYARLIGELRPRFVIVENVAALLGRGLGDVLGDLAALGYDAEWHCIPASAVGAPHRRDRLWLVAYAKHHGSLGAQIATGLRTSQKERWMQQLEGLVAVQDAADAEAMYRATLKRGEQNGDHERSEAVAYSDKLAGNQGRQSNAKKRQGRRNLDRGRIGSPVCNSNVAGLALRESQSRDVGEEFAPALGTGWRLTEPDVGRVAAGLSPELDRGERGKEEHAAEASTESNGAGRRLPSVRSNGKSAEAPSGLFKAGSGRGALSTVPHQGGSEGRDTSQADAKDVHSMRQGIHADTQQETQFVQPGVPFGRWPHECGEALAEIWSVEPDVGRVAVGVSNRVDRLKGLGNAVVPQIPELIGRAILQAEGMSP